MQKEGRYPSFWKHFILFEAAVFRTAGYRAGDTGPFSGATPDDCPVPESGRGPGG